MPSSISQAGRVSANMQQTTGIAEIWDHLPVGLGMLDQDLLLSFCNCTMQQLFQQPRAQLLNRDFFRLLNIDTQQRSFITNELNIRGCWQGIIHSRQLALRVDITRKHVGTDEVIYPVVITDYSDDYNKLTELSAAKSMAEKTDRAKSQFLSHMSHELRTPLNAILGFAQLMQVEELSAIQQDNLKEIEAAGSYLLSLINEILDLSRIEAGKIRLSEESVALDQLFQECINLVKPLAEKKNVNIACMLNTGKLLQSDHIRLKQVLLNLLSNAVKYNRSGGSVTACCHESDEHNIHIEIRDTGPGIDAELQASIFSPFERLVAHNRKIEGSGIGLMITRRLVQLMGGRIGLLSEPGRGSVFWLELPSAHAKLDNVYNMGIMDSALSAPGQTRLELVCIGLTAGLLDQIKRSLALRQHIILNDYQTLPAALPHILQHKPRCIFLSPAAASELAADKQQAASLKKLDKVVVEDSGDPVSTAVDTTGYSNILQRQHSLHELLEVLDKFFQINREASTK